MNITKKILLIAAFIAATGASYAQSKKVAVMETKAAPGVSVMQSKLVRGGMEVAVSNAPGYEGYDRAAFDKILEEQNFQRSGAVDDNQIREMGIMAGVQYVLVTEAANEDGYFYILAKLLDVETGRFMKTAEELCEASPTDIKAACSKLGAQLFGGSVSSGGSTGGGRTTPRNQDFTETAYGLNMRMIYVEGGTFTMGCTSEQGGDCDDDESPAHQVTLSGYYIGKYEVTVAEFRAFVNATGYRTDAEKEGWAWRWMQVDGKWQWNKVNGVNWRCGTNGEVRSSLEDNHPVLYVSWNDAIAFCEWLSQKSGKKYTLPTEAQWEFAARGGNKRSGYKYSGSNSIGNVAWCGNSDNAQGKTHPVGQKAPNELGIYDMSGNAWEWCQDWIGSYSSYAQTNPKGASSGSARVLRGGCWTYIARFCRVSDRNGNVPGYRNSSNGFRVVLAQ